MKALFFFLLCLNAWAQQNKYSVLDIPAPLKENANAVVREEECHIDIRSRSSVVIRTRRVVSVFNEAGLVNIGAREFRNVKSVDAVVYDGIGREIKNLRRKDFKEVMLSDAAEISDEKMLYLEYTPTTYPFTMVYESEVSDSDTAFLPDWTPIPYTGASVEKATVTVSCPAGLGLKYKELNLDASFTKTQTADGVKFAVQNLPARKNEQYAPNAFKVSPRVIFGLDKFSLEGVEGEATSWEAFGNWMQRNLLSGTTELPQDAKDKVTALVGGETDPIKKARMVYEYVQGRTRYVSIQLGIGGWKPMKVADVHRLGYGDCKALTNYTKALLYAVGVPSYYCVIHADEDKQDIDPDFVSMQGNHVTLAIPDGNKLRWVECTSQTDPFDYQAKFTDDRLALVLKPEGSALVRTHVYDDQANGQVSGATYAISPEGDLSGTIEIRSRGTLYHTKSMLERVSASERNDFYRRCFSALNNIQPEKTEIRNDKLQPEFFEKVTLSAKGYGAHNGARLMFAPNAFNQWSSIPPRYRNRLNAVEIERGFHNTDEFTIEIPEGYTVEAKPEDMTIEDVFGQYKAEFKMIDARHLLYKRSLLIKQGVYPAADYEKFRKFREQIAKADNAKCVLVKS